MNFLIQSHLSRLFMSRLWFDLWHKGSSENPQKVVTCWRIWWQKLTFFFFIFFWKWTIICMTMGWWGNRIMRISILKISAARLGSLQVRVFWHFPGKIHFVYADRSRQRRHTYIPTYACTHQTFRKKQLGKVINFSTASFFWKISKHPTSNGFAKVRTLCEHRCKKVIVMCRKRPSTRWFVDVDVLKPKRVADLKFGLPKFVGSDTSIGSHIWYLYSWMQFPWKSLHKK